MRQRRILGQTLRGNLTVTHQGGELATGELPALAPQGIEGAELSGSSVTTSIAVLHEAGHAEPWIIALDVKPSKVKARDYGMRWGIEALFSDFEPCGFAVTNTHLARADRIERLIMVLATALIHAVSTAMQQNRTRAPTPQKKPIAA